MLGGGGWRNVLGDIQVSRGSFLYVPPYCYFRCCHAVYYLVFYWSRFSCPFHQQFSGDFESCTSNFFPTLGNPSLFLVNVMLPVSLFSCRCCLFCGTTVLPAVRGQHLCNTWLMLLMVNSVSLMPRYLASCGACWGAEVTGLVTWGSSDEWTLPKRTLTRQLVWLVLL